MVWGCACGLDIIVRSFLSPFPYCELSHFSPFINKELVSLVSATPLTVLYRLWWNIACVIVRSVFRVFFPHCELCHFLPSIYRQWVFREHNSSYNFIPIFLKFCTLLFHSPKMCMCFSYNPCLKLCYFFSTIWTFSFSDLRCIDSGYLVIATSHTILYRSFWNFENVFCQVCRNARGLDMIFKLIFVTFTTLTLPFAYLRFYKSVETVRVFWAQLHQHHMRKCFRYSYINSYMTSTSPKFDLCFHFLMVIRLIINGF